MQQGQASAIVRRSFSAFASRDRATLEGLLADNFTFSSPNDDDHISKAAFFEKCWPGGDQFHSFNILELTEIGHNVLIRYEVELKDGKRFRNMEYLQVENSQLRDEEVYFGRNL